MQSSRVEFSRAVLRIIREVGELAFNMKSDQDLEKIFGIDHARLEKIIEKISSNLPDCIFDGVNTRLKEEVENIFAREFIFFQVQEKIDNPRYEEDLNSFTQVFARDIKKRIDMYKNYKLKMQEE